MYGLGENIIGSPKTRLFSIATPYSYRASNFVIVPNLLVLLLDQFGTIVHVSYLYFFSYSYCYFSILKAIAKSSRKFSAIALKSKKDAQLLYHYSLRSDNHRKINLEKKQRTKSKIKQRRLRAITLQHEIGENLILLSHYWTHNNYFVFWVHQYYFRRLFYSAAF